MTMNKVNYQKLLDGVIDDIKSGGKRKKLLLHACCAPCSSYVIEYLTEYFDITLYFYNPNISPEEEFRFREDELRRLLGEMPLPSSVNSRMAARRFSATSRSILSRLYMRKA